MKKILVYRTIALLFFIALITYTCYDWKMLNYFTGGIIFLIAFIVAGNIWDPERQKKIKEK